MIRQRQSCLESHQSEVQELPIVSLNPCINSKGTAATAQVRRLEMQGLVQLQGDFLSLLKFCYRVTLLPVPFLREHVVKPPRLSRGPGQQQRLVPEPQYELDHLSLC